MDYQKIILVGNTTADVEAKQSQKGTTYSSFSVAVNDGKEGSVSFFPVVAFGKVAEASAKVLKKGQKVLVEGRIQINEDKQFSVMANRIVFGPQAAGNTKAISADQD